MPEKFRNKDPGSTSPLGRLDGSQNVVCCAYRNPQELAREAFDHGWKLLMDTRFEGLNEIPNSVDRLRQFLQNFRERRTGLVLGGALF